MSKYIRHLLLLAAWAAAGLAQAAVTTLSGHLDDPGNTALVGPDLGSPVFTADPFDSANNVALYTFTITTAQPVQLQSTGYAAGGVDPYVSLFAGIGPSAVFLESFLGMVPGDFDLQSQPLAAGDYTLAIGMFLNMSFAENQGGTLGDGFIGLASGDFGNGYYELALTTRDDGVVPEPASLWLLAGAAAAAAWSRRRQGMHGTPAPGIR
jgi:hypothetical protein